MPFRKRYTSAQIRPIDELPNLKQRLGKAGADRIRYANRSDPRRQPNSTNLTNTVIGPMQHYQAGAANCPVADLITGVANLDYQPASQARPIPLSVSRLYNVLQCMETINTREIKRMMAVQERQAQRYLRACKLLIPQLERILLNPDN